MLIEYYHEIFPVDISWENFDEGISELINEVKMYPNLQEDSIDKASSAPHSSRLPRASTGMTSLRRIFSQMTPNFEDVSKHSQESRSLPPTLDTTE